MEKEIKVMKKILKDAVMGVVLLGGIIMAAATLIVTLYNLAGKC
jgi:hypothetical protein